MEYFNIEAVTVRHRTVSRKDGTSFEEEYREACEFPTMSGFAALISVNYDTLYAWAKRHKEFSDMVKVCERHQERILVTNTLANRYNATFAIFYAKNKLGYKDKSERELTIGTADTTIAEMEKRMLKLSAKENRLITKQSAVIDVTPKKSEVSTQRLPPVQAKSPKQ